MHLEFNMRPAQVSFLEASTNLVDWETIGTTPLSADGTFEIEDAEAANHPRRFYRLVAPR